MLLNKILIAVLALGGIVNRVVDKAARAVARRVFGDVNGGVYSLSDVEVKSAGVGGVQDIDISEVDVNSSNVNGVSNGVSRIIGYIGMAFVFLFFWACVSYGNYAKYVDVQGKILFAVKDQSHVGNQLSGNVGKFDNNIYILNNQGQVYSYNVDKKDLKEVVSLGNLPVQFFKLRQGKIYLFGLNRIVRFDLKTKKFSLVKLTYNIASNPLFDDENIYVMSEGDQLNRISLRSFKRNLSSVPLYSPVARLLSEIYMFNDYIILLKALKAVVYDKNLKLVKQYMLYDDNNVFTNVVRYISSDKKEFVVDKNGIMYAIGADLTIERLLDKEVGLLVHYNQGFKFKIGKVGLLIDDKVALKLVGYNYQMKDIGKYLYVYNDEGGVLYLGNKIKRKITQGGVNLKLVEGDDNLLFIGKSLVSID